MSSYLEVAPAGEKSYITKVAGAVLGAVAVGAFAFGYYQGGLQVDSELENTTVFNLIANTRPAPSHSIFGSPRQSLAPLEARVAGVEIPNNKRIEIALQSIYGVGPQVATSVLTNTGINPDTRTRQLDEEQLTLLRQELDKTDYIIEGDLRREIRGNIERLRAIRAYRGLRHEMGLPTRGQNTKNNARTRKGKKIAIQGKKK